MSRLVGLSVLQEERKLKEEEEKKEHDKKEQFISPKDADVPHMPSLSAAQQCSSRTEHPLNLTSGPR